MTIVVTGGGSGGHITPILAVAHELKRLDSTVKIIYIGQKGDKLSDIPAHDPNIDAVYAISAGKFRRYHGEGVKQLLDVPTMAKNARDGVRVLAGLAQAQRLLKKLQPDCVFIKGGFVGVPVGVAAARLKIPYVTHDSDAIPGLANRLIAKKAALHAVALPADVYTYPKDKTITVGVPVNHTFQPVDAAAQRDFKAACGLQEYQQVLFVTGGGLGAERLNKAVAGMLPDLLQAYPGLAVVQTAGRNNEERVKKQYAEILTDEQQGRVHVLGYTNDLYTYSGAADVVIARAGATSLAELEAQSKACIIVPNPNLTSGHQVKNAKYLEEQGAAVLVREAELERHPNALLSATKALLDDPASRAVLGAKLHSFARPDAAERLAMVLLEQGRAHRA